MVGAALMVATSGVVEVLVAVKEGTEPVPEAANPIPALSQVQSIVAGDEVTQFT